MNVELTDEQSFLREAVAGVIAREASPAHVRTWAEAGTPSAAHAIAERQGWTGIGLDEELGGQGGDAVELMVLAEELGRGAVPWDGLLGSCLGLQVLAATECEAALAVARETAEADATVLCLDGRRPPVAWPASSLIDDGLHLIASYVAGAPGASRFVVPIAGDGEVRLAGVDVSAPGVRVTSQPLVDRTRSLARVELEGAPFSDLGLVTREPMARACSLAAVLVASDALGAASRMLEMTTEYVAERRQFGVPVGAFQAVKHGAAEMLVDVEAARSAVRYASWAISAGSDDATAWASIAKSFATAAAVRVADKALFLHGAIGYTWEHDLQLLFKRAKSDERLFGSPDAHHDQIARSLGLMPAPALAM